MISGGGELNFQAVKVNDISHGEFLGLVLIPIGRTFRLRAARLHPVLRSSKGGVSSGAGVVVGGIASVIGWRRFPVRDRPRWPRGWRRLNLLRPAGTLPSMTLVGTTSRSEAVLIL